MATHGTSIATDMASIATGQVASIATDVTTSSALKGN
jgi:hypothetical protein